MRKHEQMPPKFLVIQFPTIHYTQKIEAYDFVDIEQKKWHIRLA